MRARLTTLLLVLGALATGGATVAMAVHRLADDPGAAGAPARVAKAPTVPLAAVDGPLTAEQEAAALARLASIARPVFCGGGRKAFVALTFDGGPIPGTHDIVRRLQDRKARATFFVAPGQAVGRPDLLREQLEHGSVGVQTRAAAQIAALHRAAVGATGGPVPLGRAFAGGTPTAATTLALRRAGMVHVRWSVAGGDLPGVDDATIVRNVLAGLKAGAIVRLRDGRGQTVRALPAILDAVKRRGLRAVSLPVLLTADPPSALQLRQGAAGCG